MSEKLTKVEKEALGYLYGGGDEEIVCHSAVWVITRYSHECLSIYHRPDDVPMFPAGTRMVLERARVDGQFGSCYTCGACIQAARRAVLELL
jgi:hypothetical protein